MSEAMDKVRGVRELPIFPLPVVLFPGMPMPLHIFEERYRKMLSDIRANDNLFGLSFLDASSGKETPPAGHIGCVAEVTETQALPDGRSNILAVGVIRYQVESTLNAATLIWLCARIILKMKMKTSRPLLPTRMTWPGCSCAWRIRSA
jgi:Lon protease-like protein